MIEVDRAADLLTQRKHAHFVGIGGIGMAGVAYLLQCRGFEVSGCDQRENRQTEWLRSCGLAISIGHHAGHIDASVDWVVRTTAVPDTHPEVVAAQQAGIPVTRRGDLLPALLRDRFTIAVCGTHGKTSTSSMIAQVLGCGFCVGGELAAESQVARDGKIMVVEADESDGTLRGYKPDISVITNIEFDHMEHHANEKAFMDCFRTLVQQTKERVYYCAEDRLASSVCADAHCEPYTYWEEDLPLPMPGKHNQLNAAAVMKVCSRWLPVVEIRSRLGNIKTVRRRFEIVYARHGVEIVADYAHHPTEIRTLIVTARERKHERLLALFQPHRYSRTKALMADFLQALGGLDRLWIVPVYAASEEPMDGGTSLDLMKQLSASRNENINYCHTLEGAWGEIRSHLRSGDLLLLIGAGDIENVAEWARDLNFL